MALRERVAYFCEEETSLKDEALSLTKATLEQGAFVANAVVVKGKHFVFGLIKRRGNV